MAYEDRAFAHVVPLLETGGELGEDKRRVGALLKELVERAQEAGEMRPDVKADDLPPLFIGLVLATPNGFSPARQERCVEIILDGLRYQASQEPRRGG
jgi:hypothetical protein